MSSSMNYSLAAVRVRRLCDICHRTNDLDCAGIAGVAGYETYNEYVCPHCGKLTRARTPGRITSAGPTERNLHT
jgi:predicted RNA-binding Zn-ribbon protein involved in translation (DUF1610 family)